MSDLVLVEIQQRLENLIQEVEPLRYGLRRAFALTDSDPDMSIVRMRKVLEAIVRDLYEKHVGNPRKATLENQLHELVSKELFPKKLEGFADAVRKTGNRGAHDEDEQLFVYSSDDAHRILMNLSPIVEWYVQVGGKGLPIPKAIVLGQRQAKEPRVGAKGAAPNAQVQSARELATKPSPIHFDQAGRLYQLPPLPSHFTDRDKELADLLEAIRAQTEAPAGRGTTCVVGIRGMPGIGKTALALRLAHHISDQFRDAQLFIDMHGYDHRGNSRSVSAALAHCIQSFNDENTPPENLDLLRANYLSSLRGRNVLIMCDNVAPSPALSLLLPPTGSLLILTSRDELELEGLNLIRLGMLKRNDSIALLRSLCSRLKTESSAMVDALAASSGDIAEVVRVNAGTLNKNVYLTTRTLLERLGDKTLRMKALDASLAVSCEHLDPDLRDAWFQLSIFQGDFSIDASAAVWGVSYYEATERLGRLEGASLIQPPGSNRRIQLHDLLREFADTRLDVNGRIAAENNQACHYIEVLKELDTQFLAGGESMLSSLQRFDAERLNIEVAVERLVARSRGEAAPYSFSQLLGRLVAAGPHILEFRVSQSKRRVWLGDAIDAARKIGDRSQQCRHSAFLGLALTDLKEVIEGRALLESAVSLARDVQDKQLEGDACSFLGTNRQAESDFATASQLHEKALEIHRSVGDKRGEANDLANLGATCGGPLDTQLAHLREAVRIARSIGNPRTEAFALGFMSIAYRQNGMQEEAVTCARDAARIRREIGDLRFEIADLERLVAAGWDEATHEKEIAPFVERLIDLHRETGSRESELVVMCILAAIHTRAHRVDPALKLTLTVRKQIDTGTELGTALKRNLGVVADRLIAEADRINSDGSTRSEISVGIGAAQEARLLYQTLSLESREADALFTLGYAKATAGTDPKTEDDLRSAIDHYEECRRLRQRLGESKGEGDALGNLGDAWQSLGDWKTALRYSRMALKIRRACKDGAGEGLDLANIAIDFSNLGHLKGAIRIGARALPLLEQANSRHIATVRALLESWRAGDEGGALPR